jgi:hypothetical protein
VEEEEVSGGVEDLDGIGEGEGEGAGEEELATEEVKEEVVELDEGEARDVTGKEEVEEGEDNEEEEEEEEELEVSVSERGNEEVGIEIMEEARIR